MRLKVAVAAEAAQDRWRVEPPVWASAFVATCTVWEHQTPLWTRSAWGLAMRLRPRDHANIVPQREDPLKHFRLKAKFYDLALRKSTAVREGTRAPPAPCRNARGRRSHPSVGYQKACRRASPIRRGSPASARIADGKELERPSVSSSRVLELARLQRSHRIPSSRGDSRRRSRDQDHGGPLPPPRTPWPGRTDNGRAFRSPASQGNPVRLDRPNKWHGLVDRADPVRPRLDEERQRFSRVQFNGIMG